jgi:multisubunit Na+/H+ antiporter MnhB subunit
MSKRGAETMFQAFLAQRATALLSALLGGFGVFCVLYSFTTPDIAAEALILLGAALALSYFSTRS